MTPAIEGEVFETVLGDINKHRSGGCRANVVQEYPELFDPAYAMELV